MSNAGTVHVASGQTLSMPRDYDQIGGTTTIDSGGALSGFSNTATEISGGTMTVNGTVSPRVDTSDGVLKGTGTIDGNLNNNGKTNGSNISVALQGGRDFALWAMTHGPVAGVTWQQVKVGGFTETGSFALRAPSPGSGISAAIIVRAETGSSRYWRARAWSRRAHRRRGHPAAEYRARSRQSRGGIGHTSAGPDLRSCRCSAQRRTKGLKPSPLPP